MGTVACVGNGSLYCVRRTDGYYATTAPYHDDDDDGRYHEKEEYVHNNAYLMISVDWECPQSRIPRKFSCFYNGERWSMRSVAILMMES